ncbi:MAG: hypothetical protein ACTSPT_09840 [Candidatus Heimdallarchaeota archaeon]
MDKEKKKAPTYVKSDFELSAKETYVKSFDDSELRVLSFVEPKEPKEDIEVLFIAGLLSVFQRWEKVVQELNHNYKVHYVESREKSSSKLVKRAKFKIEDMREDLAYIEKHLGLDKRKYITITSSLAGAMVLENLAKNDLTPIGNILVSPAVEVHFPKWVPPMLRILPAFMITIWKPFIRWWLRRKLEEPEQMKQYIRSVDEADFAKMRKCIIKNANRYKGWDILKDAKSRFILIGQTTDKIHETEFSFKVAKAIPNCTFIDLIHAGALRSTTKTRRKNY